MSLVNVMAFLEYKENLDSFVIASVEIEYDNGSMVEFDGSDEIIPTDYVKNIFNEYTGEDYPVLSEEYEYIVKKIVRRETGLIPNHIYYDYYPEMRI